VPDQEEQRQTRISTDNADKADLTQERAIIPAEAEKMAAYWGCKYYETSAVCLSFQTTMISYRGISCVLANRQMGVEADDGRDRHTTLDQFSKRSFADCGGRIWGGMSGKRGGGAAKRV
jgi:hypothetical protein